MKNNSAVLQLQQWLSSHLTHEQQMQFEGLFQQAIEMEAQKQLNLTDVKRLEIINHAMNNLEVGRILTLRAGRDFKSLDAQIQDGGLTFKIFIS